ncbi:SDR family oxidoreductase [bacterium]|nr:SDR family oxidoreductase [bacterium]
MAKWLVTGAKGFLGTNTAIGLQGRVETVGLARTQFTTTDYSRTEILDLRDGEALVEVIRNVRPDVIVHGAAIAGHETAAKDPDQAYAVNVTASRILAEEAEALGSTMVFISTDALFSGQRGNYREEDELEPFSVYGETKALGEEAVRAATANHLIVRTNFFGWSETGKKSILEFFVNSLRQGTPVRGYPDFVVTSIYVQSLIQAIWDLAELGATGTMHVVSDDARSKYEFGCMVAQTFGLPSELIAPLSSEEADHVTSRSRNLSLNTDKVAQLLGHRLPTQAEGIAQATRDEDGIARLIRRT